MDYKIPPIHEGFRRTSRCSGFGVGVRNLALCGVLRACEADFANSDDHADPDYAGMKSVYGLRDFREPSEDLAWEVADATYQAMLGCFGSSPMIDGLPRLASPYERALEAEVERLRATIENIKEMAR